MQLSKHFELSEFTHSAIAREKNIDNTPSNNVVSNLENLCIHVLEPARKKIKTQIHITSGYRCVELNDAVGGERLSQHTIGEAADLRCYTDFYLNNLVSALKQTGYDQLIIEEIKYKKTKMNWVHISYSSTRANRHEFIDMRKK